MIFEPKAPSSPDTFYPWFVAVVVGCLGVAQQFCLIGREQSSTIECRGPPLPPKIWILLYCYFLKIFATNLPFISTHKHSKSIIHNSIAVFSPEPYSPAGFEPGSSSRTTKYTFHFSIVFFGQHVGRRN
jgi:hypothetical protein